MGASASWCVYASSRQHKPTQHRYRTPVAFSQQPHPHISTSPRKQTNLPEPSTAVPALPAAAMAATAATRTQRVVVMRHGDRIDHAEPLWQATKPRPWDPPLTDGGLMRAWTTGKRLRAAAAAGGWRIDRVLVSPFLRCLQTAAESVAALCAEPDGAALLSLETSAGVPLDPSRVKVSIEYGLSEMMNQQAMGAYVSGLVPKINKWFPDESVLRSVLPPGTVDHSAQPLYQEVPKWNESVRDARLRYANVIKALADKYPQENLLLVTHGEGVGASVSSFMKDVEIYDVEYCAFSHLERQITVNPGDGFTAENFEVLTKSGPTGVHYITIAELNTFHAALP